jgi:hypothetical protein
VQSEKAEATIPARLFPAKPGSVPIAVAFPEHGSGRASKITACRHCGAKPLILRRCGRNRSCAVCQHCGFHHRVKLTT